MIIGPGWLPGESGGAGRGTPGGSRLAPGRVAQLARHLPALADGDGGAAQVVGEEEGQAAASAMILALIFWPLMLNEVTTRTAG